MQHPKCCTKNLTVFKFDPTSSNMLQHIATYRNRVAKRMQHVVPNNVARCCVELLRAFGQAFTHGFQVSNVAYLLLIVCLFLYLRLICFRLCYIGSRTDGVYSKCAIRSLACICTMCVWNLCMCRWSCIPGPWVSGGRYILG